MELKVVITLNGEPLQLPQGQTLAELLHQQQICPDSVATACNGQFVPRALRAAHPLRAGDTVLCFQAITGG
jgi:sulfur carrier protein